MDVNTFDDIVRGQIKLSEDVLLSKAAEYADDSDRLHNFRVAARLQDVTPEQALAGMMAKHSVSVYDMVRSGDDYPLEKWEEKIGDHINYLLLLKALVIDTGRAQTVDTTRSDCPGQTLTEWLEEHYPKNTVQDMYQHPQGRSIISDLIGDWDEDREERDIRIAEALTKSLGKIFTDEAVGLEDQYEFPRKS
jgi:hypothetical protein